MEKDLFASVMEEARNGERITVDFKKRNLKVNGCLVVENGKSEYESRIYVEEWFLKNVEDYYRQYKHSVPSERSESRGRRYFNALPESGLSDEDMMYGVPRELAQAQLEVYILCCLMEGMKWNEEWGNWFWQSKEDPDLVLLREWFE